MSQETNAPVRVTGEERKHPALRQLARACIALARLRLEQQAQAEHVAQISGEDIDAVGPQNGVTGEEDVLHG